jgi:hypothetical protein
VFQSCLFEKESCGIGKEESTAMWLLYLRNKGFYQNKVTNFLEPGDFDFIFFCGKLFPRIKMLKEIS